MIYTVGFNTIPGALEINKEFHLLNEQEIKDTYVFVKAMGAERERWVKPSPISPQFHLSKLTPSQEDCININQFLFKGGTVISSLENPNKPIITMAFQDEVDCNTINSYVKIRDCGEFLELEYKPYNWLDKQLRFLPERAFNSMQGKGFDWINGAEVKSVIETVTFSIGENNGKLIFTNLLKNNSYLNSVHDLTLILKSVLGKEKGYVTSR